MTTYIAKGEGADRYEKIPVEISETPETAVKAVATEIADLIRSKAAKNEKMYSLINSTHVGFPPAWCQCQYSQLFFLCHNKIYARCNVKDLEGEPKAQVGIAGARWLSHSDTPQN